MRSRRCRVNFGDGDVGGVELGVRDNCCSLDEVGTESPDSRKESGLRTLELRVEILQEGLFWGWDSGGTSGLGVDYGG